MLAMPDVEGAVKLIVQLELPAFDPGTRLQDGLEKLPDTPVAVIATVPVGDSGLPAVELSTTTAVHSAAWFTTTCVVHTTVVVVVRWAMVILVGELWLLPCAVSVGVYAAMIETVPDPAGAINVDAHEAVPVELGTSGQGEPVKVPDTPVSEKLTVPVGVRGEPEVELSDTVAVQVDPWFTRTGVAHRMVVLVGRNPTVIENPGLGLEL